MELNQAIRERRSIRKYNDRIVEREVINQIIEAGTWAPSACNVQGWRFILINDKTKFEELISNGAAAFLKNVSQAILIVYENTTDNIEYSDYIQSASACIENMQLKAFELNVGSCWVNFLPSKKQVKKIFNIPWNYSPVALMTIGYYDQKLNERVRKYVIDDLISVNTFSGGKSIPQNRMKINVKRAMRKVYFVFPFKKLLNKFIDKKEKKFDN